MTLFFLKDYKISTRNHLQNQIAASEKELAKPEFKLSKSNYMKLFVEVNVIEKMINDLAKFKSALEWALMKYHAEKMGEINRTIRGLWGSIYRGNDIDYIQIKTDEEKADGKSTEKKRNYNYRVVQAKNGGIEIDMRGRCSAGQKVLASLIIRMALAETFSHNCGVLALDEPTTNLDRANIASLCEALCKIVDERQQTNNFMLIVITHDEEFVTAMDKVDQ